jgi:hypothetical protein
MIARRITLNLTAQGVADLEAIREATQEDITSTVKQALRVYRYILESSAGSEVDINGKTVVLL